MIIGRHLRGLLAAILTLSLTVVHGQAQAVCAQPTDVVNFPDQALAAAVASALELEAGNQVQCGELAKLRDLRANGAGITDLTGLEHASDLRRLDLRSNRVVDLG